MLKKWLVLILFFLPSLVFLLPCVRIPVAEGPKEDLDLTPLIVAEVSVFDIPEVGEVGLFLSIVGGEIAVIPIGVADKNRVMINPLQIDTRVEVVVNREKTPIQTVTSATIYTKVEDEILSFPLPPDTRKVILKEPNFGLYIHPEFLIGLGYNFDSVGIGIGVNWLNLGKYNQEGFRFLSPRIGVQKIENPQLFIGVDLVGYRYKNVYLGMGGQTNFMSFSPSVYLGIVF